MSYNNTALVSSNSVVSVPVPTREQIEDNVRQLFAEYERSIADLNFTILVVIYARYSSHNQRDESIEQQISECLAYAIANNMRVIAIYFDRHISGKTDKRPDFQRMIRHAEHHQFQFIISYKSNRIARNMLNALVYEDKLEKFGVRCVYVKEEFGNTAAGRFALRTMMNVNQFYSENMSEDIQRGMSDNAVDCKVNSSLPLGFKKGADGRYAIDEKEAPIVREVFSRVSNGEPFIEIIKDLNARCISTKRGYTWNRSSFHCMLKNERYIGVYKWNGVRVENGIPPIVDKEVFYAVQEILKIKKNPQGRHRENGDYLLTGKLFCGKCKHPMVGISGTGRNGMHHYYICQNKRKGGNCDKKTVRRDWAEYAIAEAVRIYILRDDVIEWIADTTVAYAAKHLDRVNIQSLELQLSSVKKSLQNLMVAIEQGIITETTKSRLLDLEAEQSRLNSRIIMEKSQLQNITRDQVIFFLESFRNLDITNKNVQSKLFKNFLVAAYLNDKELRIVFNYTGKKNTIRIPINPETIDNANSPGTADGSYKLPSPPPNFFEKKFGSKSFIFLNDALIQMDSRFFYG